jgi:8-oxo-dGTP diphosphatase
VLDRPEATVAAIITINQDGVEKVLLTLRERGPFEGQWCLPGGHIDNYETARGAIFREVKEETGLDFKARFFGCFDEIIPKDDIHAVVSVYVGQGIGEPKPQAGEVAEMRWFSIDEALSLPLAFAHHDVLKAYACRASESADSEPESGALAEYAALRSEILKRVEMRQQILIFTLVIAGTLLTLGLKFDEISVLVIFPILAMLLALVWMQNDLRIGEIGEFIRKRVILNDLRWEAFIRQEYANRRLRPMEVSAWGVFLVTEALSLGIVISKMLPFSPAEVIYLAVDVIAIILTAIFIRRRRSELYLKEA